MIPKPRQLKVSFAKITATKELSSPPAPTPPVPSPSPSLSAMVHGERSLAHPRHSYTRAAPSPGPRAGLGDDDGDGPRRRPRPAPPASGAGTRAWRRRPRRRPRMSARTYRRRRPSMIASCWRPPRSCISPRGAPAWASGAPSPTGLLRRYWTRARSPADGSRGCSTCTPRRCAARGWRIQPSFLQSFGRYRPSRDPWGFSSRGARRVRACSSTSSSSWASWT